VGRAEDLVLDDFRFERSGIVESRSRQGAGVVGAEE
jgi:hypothetical protein